jgi:hypothetical protein
MKRFGLALILAFICFEPCGRRPGSDPIHPGKDQELGCFTIGVRNASRPSLHQQTE